jgi:DME family drug/metabolite transporter
MASSSSSPSALRDNAVRGYLLILTAATFWATIGVFYTLLIDRHAMTPLAAAALRGALGGIILLVVLLLLRVNLRVPRRDWLGFLAYGIFGVALFFITYVNAIHLTGVAVAAVLLYTSPAWVAVISSRWMGEHLGRRGVAALLLAVLGAALVARIYNLALLRLNAAGILMGLAAGLTYGLYSIFNKVLVRRNRPWVVQVYGLLIGAGILLALAPRAELARGFASPESIGLLLGMALVPTLLASLSFAIGVQWVPVSVAAIVATWEPVVAALFGYLFFGERLDFGQWLGTACILSAVLLLRPDMGSAVTTATSPENATTAAPL